MIEIIEERGWTIINRKKKGEEKGEWPYTGKRESQ